MPRHIPDGHSLPTILANNPPTHAATDVPSHPSNAVCNPTPHRPQPPPTHTPPPIVRSPPSFVPRLHCYPPSNPAIPHVTGEVRVGYSGSASPTLPPPVLQPPLRPVRPPMADKGALRRHLQATVLAREPHSPFHSPMHHTFMPHQTSSRPAQPLAPLIPTPQMLTSLSSHVPMPNTSLFSSQASPPRLPTSTHDQAVFHTHPDDPFSLSPTSSIR